MNYDVERIRKVSAEELTAIDGIGQVIADSVVAYFADEKNNRAFDRLLKCVEIADEATDENSMRFNGMTFVITGSLNHFENRNTLKTLIEDGGGKVAGSVSSKTAYLINNDSTSSSSKNKKAQSLNIPIITEEEFIEKFKITGV